MISSDPLIAEMSSRSERNASAPGSGAQSITGTMIVYDVDSLVCSKCGSQMKVIAVIQDTDETKHILRHLIKIGRVPPGLDESSVN